MSKYVFISYAHNESYSYEVIKFKDQLAEQLIVHDFKIFFDVDKLQEGDWERKIDANICKSEWFIFIVSKRSVSYSGFCLNELSRAHERNIKIIPVLLDNSSVPITINRLQRYSLFENNGIVTEKKIIEAVAKISNLIISNSEVGYFDEDIMLEQSLRPINFESEISRHRLGFTGREQLFSEVERWLYSNESKNKLFLVKAFPGFGKTAFSANCSLRFNDAIGAVHFCKFDNAQNADAKRIVTSIAFWLGCKLSAYREELVDIVKKNGRLYDDPGHNATSLFGLLFVDALSHIKHDDSPVLVIIDALDEAIWQGHINNELCNLLRMHVDMLPKWFKILVTTREDSSIISDLMNVSVTYELTREVNESDLKQFFKDEIRRLGRVKDDEQLNKTIDLLFTKSEGSFIYAREIINKIIKEGIALDKIDELPNGLYELYKSTFNRIFDVLHRINYEEVRPFLELLCVTPEELTVSFICEYFDWSETEMRKKLDVLSSLVSLKEESVNACSGQKDRCFKPIVKKVDVIHKTIKDWLTQSNESGYDYAGKYHISEHDAYLNLLNYIEENLIKENEYNLYALRHYGMVLIKLIEREPRDDNRKVFLNKLFAMLINGEFQNERISKLTLDVALKTCSSELRCYYEYCGNDIYQVYKSKTFISVFSKHRRYLYNSGLFFLLKKVGFSKFLSIDCSDWGLEGEVGKTFYHYITEDFNKTISSVNEIVTAKKYRRMLAKNKRLKAELFNVKGLAQRKIVDFSEALKSFDEAIKNAADCNYSYELSLAYLIKSKINIRMCNEKECRENGALAIKWLNDAIEKSDNYNIKLDYTLFLAEEYRVLCDNMIWVFDLEAASYYMKQSQNIYSNHVTTDRYYIRSQYTKLFLRIEKGEKDLLNKIDNIESKIHDGLYDIGQINIIKSIYLMLYGNNKDEALVAAKKAYNAYDKINCPLEREEACCLYNIIAEEIENVNKLPMSSINSFINNWLIFYREHIIRLKNTIRGSDYGE